MRELIRFYILEKDILIFSRSLQRNIFDFIKYNYSKSVSQRESVCPCVRMLHTSLSVSLSILHYYNIYSTSTETTE